MNKGYKKFLRILVTIIIIGLVYIAGYTIGHKNLSLESGYKPKLVNLQDGKPKDVDFSLFWDSWNIIKNYFFNTNPDIKKMVYGAINGMINSLNDPYTMFMTPEEGKNFEEDLSGSFDGIGVEVSPREGYLIVISPLDDMPAKNAGIRSKDVIAKIDGEDVGQMTYAQAINKIRGVKGSEVVLTVIHDGESDPVDIKIIRDTVTVKSVKWEIKDGNIMYVRISQFGEDTFDLINQVADEVSQKGINKIIIDVRDNPGGYLQKCIDITSLFINEGVVVQEKDRDGKITQSKTTRIPRFNDDKLVVLINGGSASASEIFAGAIKDHKRGVLIGEKSFGKGSVQTMQTLKDGSEIKVTIAKWLTPNGDAIDKLGIKPDIEIKTDESEISSGNDTQLKKAIEEVNK